MKKYILWSIFIPVLMLIIRRMCLVADLMYFPETAFSFFESFATNILIYGTVIICPICLLLISILYVKKEKVKIKSTIIVSSVILFLNGVINFPVSILVYLGLREWGTHDVDLLPVFVLIPMCIFFVGLGVYQVVEILKK